MSLAGNDKTFKGADLCVFLDDQNGAVIIRDKAHEVIPGVPHERWRNLLYSPNREPAQYGQTIEKAMGRIAEYQGYTIESAPQYEPHGQKWGLRIYISLQDSRGIQTREFASDTLYASEQEADIHGIAFGQRVIDGKVDGWTVWDMKSQDRRITPRFRVQFRTTFSSAPMLDGTGTILDLSAGGCRVESALSLTPGVALELRIYAPGLEWPLMVEAATVQWVSSQMFGLAFFRMTESERQRLEQVIGDLTSTPT